jgi:hypothetical protein
MGDTSLGGGNDNLGGEEGMIDYLENLATWYKDETTAVLRPDI